jgi:predicted outer membrane repeat protein
MEGGAFFGSGQNGSSRPTFSNCHFLKNKAKVDGGAIYSDGRDGSTNQFSFNNCRFEDNYSTYGAGIYLENGNDLTGLVVDRCVFINNIAALWGGGIYYNFPPPGGYFEFQIEDCLFEKNYPTDVNKNRFLSNTDRDLAKR